MRRACIYKFSCSQYKPETGQPARLDLRDGIKTMYSYTRTYAAGMHSVMQISPAHIGKWRVIYKFIRAKRIIEWPK